MKPLSVPALAWIAALAPFSSPSLMAAQIEGSMEPLVPAGWVSPFVFGTDVSADGSVVVGYGDSPASGFLWTAAGGAVDMNAVLGQYCRCLGVSADGQYVVGSSGATITGAWTPFRWSAAGGREDLPSLGTQYATATAVSDDGAVVVGAAHRSGQSKIGFRWTASGVQDLGNFGPGGSITEPFDMSADGSVVVGRASINAAGNYYRAFLWTQSTGLVNLGAPGGTSSEARAVSSDGSVVVGTLLTNSGGGRPFLWTAATGMQLAPLSLTGSTAYDVSADGSIVVGESWGLAPGFRRAFRWDVSTGDVVDLGTLGGDVARAAGVSEDGRVVVGWSTPLGSQLASTFRWAEGVHHSIGVARCSSATPNSSGVAGVLDVLGSNAVQANFVELVARNLPLNSLGYFVTSRLGSSAMPVGNSAGLLCLGGSIGRFIGPGQVQDSGTSGAFTLPIDLAWVPQPTGSVAIAQGETWFFQAWHRDAVGGVATSNFTSSVEVMFR